MSSHSLRNEEPIPDNDHVVRYCQEGKWKQRQGDGVVIYQDAFESENHPELGISVNWLEYWKCSEKEALRRIVNTSGHQGMRPEGRFLKLKSQDIRELRLKATKITSMCVTSHLEKINPMQ